MPLTITKVEVIAVAGELAGTALTDPQWETVLLLTNEQCNVGAFPSQIKADLAARYLAAHIGVKLKQGMASGAGAGGASGPLSSITVGDVSKTFRTSGAVDQVAATSAELLGTAYGREYYRLMRLWAPRMILA